MSYVIDSDVNKDLNFKAKDKDKDQTLKAKDQDKDHPRTRTTTRPSRPMTRTRTSQLWGIVPTGLFLPVGNASQASLDSK